MRRKSLISPFAIFSIALFLITELLVFFAGCSFAVANFLNDGICQYFRRAMAWLGGLVPISLYEVIMLSLPAVIVLVVILAVRRFVLGEGRVRFILNLAAVVLVLLAGDNFALGIGYHTTPIDSKMGLSSVEVTEDRLAEIMISLRDEINSLSEEIAYTENGVSDPEMTFREMSDLAVESYGKVYESYGFSNNFYSYAKRVHFGNLMSYLGITGIYTYYTGDANVNSAYPDYDIAFTIAHELAHQRGVLRENEANFMAYLVTSSSDNPYLRYAGALNMYQYIGSALYRTNKELYGQIHSQLCEGAYRDVLASYAVSEKYGDTFIADISNYINDLFLKSNGTAGVVTYGRVVTLTVAYFEANK